LIEEVPFKNQGLPFFLSSFEAIETLSPERVFDQVGAIKVLKSRIMVDDLRGQDEPGVPVLASTLIAIAHQR